jgi:hypothetical protein
VWFIHMSHVINHLTSLCVKSVDKKLLLALVKVVFIARELYSIANLKQQKILWCVCVCVFPLIFGESTHRENKSVDNIMQPCMVFLSLSLIFIISFIR